MSGRMDVTVLGQIVGTADRWNEMETAAVEFKNFKPNELGLEFLCGQTFRTAQHLFLDFRTGEVMLIEASSDGGTDSITIDAPRWGALSKQPS